MNKTNFKNLLSHFYTSILQKNNIFFIQNLRTCLKYFLSLNFRKLQTIGYILLLFFSFLTLPAKAIFSNTQKSQLITLELGDVEKKVLYYSQAYKSATFEFNAAQSKINVAKSQKMPLIKLDGTYTYVTEVPKWNSVALSDNQIYSIGPTITYSLFDSGYAKNDIKSVEAIADAKKLECNAIKNEIILKARLAYIESQLYMEQLHLVADSLKLAQKQYKDISKRASIGTTNSQDVLASHKEVLRFELECRQIQDTLSAKIVDILALIGMENNFDMNNPWDADFDTNFLTNSPSVLLKLDSLNTTLSQIEKTVSLEKQPKSFRIEALKSKKESLKFILEKIKSNNKPKIQISERSSLEYPEEITLDKYIQNAVSLNFSMNLWDGTKNKSVYSQTQNELNSYDEQQKNLETELSRDYTKAYNTFISLKSQQKIAEQGVSEMEKFANLVYGSYQAGQIGYLEVENANLRVLEWKFQLTMIKAKIATQLVILDFYLC